MKKYMLSALFLILFIGILQFFTSNMTGNHSHLKFYKINNTVFNIPEDFHVSLDKMGRLSFLLNAFTFQLENKQDAKNNLRIQIIPEGDHPGSFYLRESAINASLCKYRIEGNFRICEYINKDRGLVSVAYLGDAIYMIGNCTLYKKETSLIKTCQAWGPLKGGLTIAYSYPEELQENFIVLDFISRYIVKNFYK